ncbi:hypothetical protein LPYR103PRE_24050 [Segatella asaccharophila]
MKKVNKKNVNFKFAVINDSFVNNDYTAGCSGGKSDCCTRVCTRYAQPANTQQWGKFLEVNAGVVQY